jgi:predicted ABC-type ATPase
VAAGANPILHVIAGPNGAGKTTFYEIQIRALTDAEFVNADLLALEHFGHVAVTREESETGQALADGRRRALMAEGRSLVIESTFSHPSKLDLIEAAKAAGYRVVVYHVNVKDDDRAVARVESRVRQGGHPAPEERIRKRYERNQPLIREAVLAADRAYIFDNSRLGEPPRILVTFRGGRAAQVAEVLPQWAATLYGDDVAKGHTG